jgi:hypothetical protein
MLPNQAIASTPSAPRPSAPGPEVSAGFLQEPEKARLAIQLAAKLHRQRMPYGASAAPPVQQGGMQRGLGAAQLSQRLQALSSWWSKGR